MARVIVDGEDLVVRLRPGEKLVAIRGDVAVEPKPWSALRGIRVAPSRRIRATGGVSG